MQEINLWAVKSFINKGEFPCIFPPRITKKPWFFFGLQPLTTVTLGGFNPSASEIQLTFKNVSHPAIQTLMSGSFQVAWGVTTHRRKKQCMWGRAGSSFRGEVDHYENSLGVSLNSAPVSFWCFGTGWKPSQKCTDLKILVGVRSHCFLELGIKLNPVTGRFILGHLFFFFLSLIWKLYFQSPQTSGELTVVIWWVPSYFSNK